MWRDSETELDFLDFDYLINILIDTINDEKLLPSSIGLYGDWGSGKSSLMYMCKNELEKQNDGTICLLFNGWLYESYDDAKTAMLGSILDGIKANCKVIGQAAITLKALYDSVDKFKLIKSGLKFGIDMALTGGIGAFAGLTVRSIAEKAANKVEGIETEDIVDKVKNALDYKELREDIREFRDLFSELLSQAGIKKLVIFVDELDRCSPDTILDTLEAMRLFLFNGKVAFVIGADERHINYAIKTKFSDIEGINMNIGKEYQEKLIQYPIRIPSLNEAETEFYIMCLIAQERIDVGEFDEMLVQLKQKKKENFLKFELSHSVIKEINESIADKIKDDILTAKQLAPILTKGLNGNPRQCKRFLNAVDMRMKMAHYRGIDLNTRVLAKIMEAEYFRTSLFRKMASLLRDDNLKEEIKNFENKIFEDVKELSLWKDDPWVVQWMTTEPLLAEEKLEEYFYFMRTSLENKTVINMQKMSDAAQRIFEGLHKHSELVLKTGLKQISELSDFDSKQILDRLFDDLIQDELLNNTKLKFFLTWGAAKKELQISTIEYLDGISGEKITKTMLPLIAGFYTDCKDKSKCSELFIKWKKDNSEIEDRLDRIVKGE